MEKILLHVVLRSTVNIYEHIHESVTINTYSGEINPSAVMDALIDKGLPIDVRKFNIIVVGYNL